MLLFFALISFFFVVVKKENNMYVISYLGPCCMEQDGDSAKVDYI